MLITLQNVLLFKPGIPEEYIEPWRTSVNIITFQREGDSLQNYKWKLVHDSSIMGMRTYEFTSGVEVTTTDPEGGPLKVSLDPYINCRFELAIDSSN